ncbi:MAG: hypothetical protein A2682_03950 [Candidatus Terrybacteria bacterium RIFCSPHIGHO2_01_FULL_58_15]|uniref:CvpA family protein n=1 Tax=Terrybacteria sp. (strain RIFCSPHIGHO2_01_FULL_58_15) TaxID=1802363 RepID=A0A1G2PLD3_TERXR|nr:MAG: hypothetical protein A2682_03950 [Candidatus Terrybacteria bacterium RIFCSPHIGHO2_01_FULL_58_15]
MQDLSGLSADLLVLLALSVLLFVLGLTGGRKFFVPFLVGLYVASVVTSMLPTLRTFLLRFGTDLPAQTPAAIFLLALAFTTWLLAGSAVTAVFRFSGRGVGILWQVAAASILGAGLFGVLFIPTLPRGTLTPSAPVAQWLLADPLPFLWALAPVVFFAILRVNED